MHKRGRFLVGLGLVATLDVAMAGCGGATTTNAAGGGDAGGSDASQADAMPTGSSDAGADAAGAADAATLGLVWGSDEQGSASGTAPTVVAGPGAGGSWACTIYAPVADQAVWQTELVHAITSVQLLGGGTLSSGGADLPTATALTTTGSIFEMHMQAPTTSTFWWWLGQLDATQEHAVWPSGITFPSSVRGYRPRVASTETAPGQGAYIAFVYMNGAAPGPLSYYTMQWTGDGDPDDASTVGNLAWSSGTPTVYDDGLDQNPALAIAAPASGSGHATVIEAHQDATTGLYFRLGDLPLSGTHPTITWQSSVSQLPGQAQGAHPAIATYGSLLLEVHEGTPAGTLMYTVGTVGDGGIEWHGSTAPYTTGGVAPAIAIDPTSGRGVEVHQPMPGDAGDAGAGYLIEDTFAFE
jgi:hypothetical protein